MARTVRLAAVLLCIMTFCHYSAVAAGTSGPLVLIFDSSGSMNEQQGGTRKIDQAKEVVRDLFREFPPETELGLVIFGHRRSRDCTDIETVEPVGPVNAEKLKGLSDKIMALNARGETPIAETLLHTSRLFQGRPGRIVMVTDGREECGGDVCGAAAKLAQMGLSLKVDIVGFGLNDAAKKSLSCITDETGGKYYDASNAQELRKALQAATEDFAGRTRLTVVVTEGKQSKAPRSMVRVRGADGFDVSQFENPAVFRLQPGSYQVTAHIGNEPESSPVTVDVEEGQDNQVEVDMGTGTIRIEVTAGEGKPLARRPMIHLVREGESAIAAAMQEHKAEFHVRSGRYTAKVSLSSGQSKEFPGIDIPAAQIVDRKLEVPAGQLKVSVKTEKYTPGQNPYPMVQVQQSGRNVAALSDNPAEFQLLEGTYTVLLLENGQPAGTQTVEIKRGEEKAIELTGK